MNDDAPGTKKRNYIRAGPISKAGSITGYQLRDRYAPSSRTAILSNSTRVQDPAIRTALKRLDVKIMKLDAGTEKTFKAYNRPCTDIILDEIIQGLSSLEGVTIQSLFTKGPSGNFEDSDISEWIESINRISPICVQIYSLDRGVPSDAIGKLNKDELFLIRSRLQNENIHSEVYWRE